MPDQTPSELRHSGRAAPPADPRRSHHPTCDFTAVARRLHAVRLVGSVRDLLIVAVGLLTLHATPPSIQQVDGTSWVSALWSAALILGGLACIVGIISARAGLETVGAFTSAGGFLVWSVAAFGQPDLTLVSVAVALVFLAGFVGQVQKGLLATVLQPPKTGQRDA